MSAVLSPSLGAQWPQLSIFPAAEPGERGNTLTVAVGEDAARKRARRSDPATSHQAAERAALFAGSQKTRILLALEQLGSGTAAEVGKVCGLSVEQVDRRRHELVRDGKVRLLTGLDGKAIERDGFNVMARVA